MADTGTITFGGLVTGLDTKTLITQLVGLSRQPIRRLEQNRLQEEKKISTFKDFNNKMLAFKSAADKLLKLTNFFARTSSVSNDSAIGVSVTSTAQTGNYTLTIDQLARPGQQTFMGLESKTSQTLSGTFTIENTTTNPSDFSMRINANGMTLEELRDSINRDVNNDGKVMATIIDTGVGAERYHLQIKGNATGTINDFDITSTGSLSKDNNTIVTFLAQDAKFSVDGVYLTRSENTISDVIDGITLTLKKATSELEMVTVENDTGYIQSNITSFINSYNEIRSYINSNSIVDQKNPQNNGPFLGDSTVRGVYIRLQQIMTSAVSGINENFSALHDIGVTTGTDGKLEVDQNKLSNVLRTNISKVSKIFIGTDSISGIAALINSEMNKFSTPVGGIIDIRIDGIQSRILNISDRIDVIERRISNYERSLIKQFTALEQLIGSLQVKGSALGNMRG